MKSRDEIENKLSKILNQIDADSSELLYSATDNALTRFASNTIHQNVQQNSSSLTIKIILNNVVGQASTNQLDDNSILECIKKAKLCCELSQKEKDLPDLLGHQNYQTVDSFDEDTQNLSPAYRAEMVKLACQSARKKGLEAAGKFNNSTSQIAIFNSNGLRAYHKETSAIYSMTATDGEVSGWSEAMGCKAMSLPFHDTIFEAVDSCLMAKKPKSFDAGKYTVVLTPEAAAEFLYFLAFYAFNGQAFNEGHSPFSSKLGQKLFSEKINISDNAYHPLINGMPFDLEGHPKKVVKLVQNGIAKAVVHDRLSAKNANTNSTGHALPQPNPYGPIPTNLVIDAGKEACNIKDMIAQTERGLFVTHFHYTNVINPMQQILTGMTRDGLFLIENGKIASPINNLRFTESAFQAYSNIESISSDQKLVDAGFGGGFVVPAMKIKKFTFTSKTEF